MRWVSSLLGGTVSRVKKGPWCKAWIKRCNGVIDRPQFAVGTVSWQWIRNRWSCFCFQKFARPKWTLRVYILKARIFFVLIAHRLKTCYIFSILCHKNLSVDIGKWFSLFMVLSSPMMVGKLIWKFYWKLILYLTECHYLVYSLTAWSVYQNENLNNKVKKILCH